MNWNPRKSNLFYQHFTDPQKMQSLSIPYKEALTRDISLRDISAAMDLLPKNPIDKMPWPENYKPEAAFAAAHNDLCLFIKFYVAEQAIRAVYSRPHDPVYKDTCVEAFLAFNGEPAYYNFEFNCLGTCLAGYGTGRNDRRALPEENIARIQRLSVIDTNHDSAFPFQWQLTLAVPLEVFGYHRFTGMKGLESRGNFYKCGDDLPQPHYLAWNNIEATEPDFHLPEFFGRIKFT